MSQSLPISPISQICASISGTSTESMTTGRQIGAVSSGPMSEGLISVRSHANQNSHNSNDSTERVCMFAVCLMFIGIPIIVLGVIFLTFFAPIGVILLMIGVIASTSGAFLAILSAVLSVFKKQPKSTTRPANYGDGRQVPDITIESTNYSETFDDNLCHETSQPPLQSLGVNLHQTKRDEQNLPDTLDPVYWSNYPEAQNPKLYLNSFGDLPKVIPSPEPSSKGHKSAKSDKSGHKSFKDKYDDKIKRKISKTIKMGIKRRTMSRTELTRDFSDDQIDSTSSSSDHSTSPVNRNPSLYHIQTNQYPLNPNQSIITIENFHINVNTTDDNNESELDINAGATSDVIFARNSSADDNLTEDNTDYTTTKHSIQTNTESLSQTNSHLNAISDERKDITLDDSTLGERQTDNEILKPIQNSTDSETNFSNLWTNIRPSNK